MWSIGIKSGLITVLGLIAYGLIVQLIGLQHVLWDNLTFLVLALGIYSGHYYFKAANNGSMSYKQGLKLGLIIVTFTSLVNALPIYLYAQWAGAFIVQLQENVQRTLQQTATKETATERMMQLVQHMTPALLCIGIFVSTMVLGLLFTLGITAFSKHTSKPSSP
ncbi:MAG: DUF4199 domain-containing protein [Bacteroidota bacterium]